jgi:hypothetical protein
MMLFHEIWPHFLKGISYERKNYSSPLIWRVHAGKDLVALKLFETMKPEGQHPRNTHKKEWRNKLEDICGYGRQKKNCDKVTNKAK